MTQIELILDFALGWTVYFILYIGIGILSALVSFLLTFYHYIFSTVRPRPQFVLYSYYGVVYPQVFKGLFIAIIPFTILLILNSIIMIGSFWDMAVTFDDSCLQ